MKKSRMNPIRLGVIGIICIMALLLVSCSRGASRIEVRLDIPDPQGINLDSYNKIVYKDLTLESMPKEFNPESEVRRFFLDDFAKALEKKVEPWDSEKHGDNKSDPGVLVLTGTLKLDVKERSKIEDKKDETGKKQRAFVNVQHWSMNLSLSLKDAVDGKEVFKFTYDEKLAEVNPTNPKFNFEAIFYKITNQLVQKLMKKKKMETRYLLL
jgi:hypothetical protein